MRAELGNCFFRVLWTPPDPSYADRYLVEVRPDGDLPFHHYIQGSRAGVALFTRVPAGLTFLVKVRAENDYGESPYVPPAGLPVRIAPVSRPVEGTHVTSARIRTSGRSGLRLFWDCANGAEEYRVRWAIKPATPDASPDWNEQDETVRHDGTQHYFADFENLEPQTAYLFQVRGEAGFSSSDWWPAEPHAATTGTTRSPPPAEPLGSH